MKKGLDYRKISLFLIFISLIISIFVNSIGFVAASTVTDTLDKITANVSPVISWIVGDVSGGTEYILLKFLFLIILICVIYLAARATPVIGENGFISWIITLAVSIAAIRYFFSSQLVEFAWLPTGVLGVTLVSFLPFILFFFLMLKIDYSIVRKIGWIFFTVIYFVLAIYRWEDLSFGDIWWQNLGWAYVIIAVLSILVLIFDKQLRARMLLSSMKASATKQNIRRAQLLLTEIDSWEDVRASSHSTPAEIKTAEKEIDKLRKQVANLK